MAGAVTGMILWKHGDWRPSEYTLTRFPRVVIWNFNPNATRFPTEEDASQVKKNASQVKKHASQTKEDEKQETMSLSICRSMCHLALPKLKAHIGEDQAFVALPPFRKH